MRASFMRSIGVKPLMKTSTFFISSSNIFSKYLYRRMRLTNTYNEIEGKKTTKIELLYFEMFRWKNVYIKLYTCICRCNIHSSWIYILLYIHRYFYLYTIDYYVFHTKKSRNFIWIFITMKKNRSNQTSKCMIFI